MVDSNAIALIFSDGASSRMLREVIRVVGCPIVYEASVATFASDVLAESGANIVVVDLGPEAEIDSIFDLLDDDRYRVIVNDAEVTGGLSGWEHARWARHLAAKILGVPAVVDPPRPEEASVMAADAIASMKSRSRPASPASGESNDKPASSAAELGIDDWLSEVLQVKDSAGLFVESTPKDSSRNDAIVDTDGVYGAPSTATESRRKTDQEAVATAAQVSAPVPPAAAEPAKPAAEERFDWNIEDVIRDIDDWLPPPDPGLASIDPTRAARLWSRTTEVAPNLTTGGEPQPLEAGKDKRIPEPVAGIPEPSIEARWAPPSGEGRFVPAQPTILTAPFSPPGIAAMKGSGTGHLAHSLELTPLEQAALTPLFDCQHPEPAEDMIVDVVPTPATVSRVIVLCASVGGPEAIRVLLGAIPANHPALFLVVQQVGEEFLDLLSQQLRRATALRIRSADLGDQLRDGEVIPVSPRQRLVIDRSGRVMLNQRTDAIGSAPMNQVLRDVSDQFGEDCTAVVLSGIASDATEGCRYLAERGGRVCAQAPASCVSSGMVDQVQQTGVVSFLGTPTELAAHLLLDRR